MDAHSCSNGCYQYRLCNTVIKNYIGPIVLADRKMYLFSERYDDPISHGDTPDSKVHGANMGATWGRQDPGGPHISLGYLLIYPPQIATVMKLISFCSKYNPVSHTKSLGESQEWNMVFQGNI